MNDKLLKQKFFDEPDYKYVDRCVCLYFVSLFEKLTRAIVRQFTMGNIGSVAKNYIGFYSHFLFLKDEDIGKTNYYNKFFNKEKKAPKPYKKNLNVKRITITKKNYKKLWPFKNTNNVIIEKRENNCIVIIINDAEYALNGFASKKYNLPFPHDVDEAYVGRSVSDFISIGLEL